MSTEEIEEHKALRVTFVDISKSNLETARFPLADRTYESTQDTALLGVFSRRSAPKNCSGTAFGSWRERIFITGGLVRIQHWHVAIAAWVRRATAGSFPACDCTTLVGPIVGKGLRTEVSFQYPFGVGSYSIPSPYQHYTPRSNHCCKAPDIGHKPGSAYSALRG